MQRMHMQFSKAMKYYYSRLSTPPYFERSRKNVTIISRTGCCVMINVELCPKVVNKDSVKC